jgi:hypothetical protein
LIDPNAKFIAEIGSFDPDTGSIKIRISAGNGFDNAASGVVRMCDDCSGNEGMECKLKHGSADD